MRTPSSGAARRCGALVLPLLSACLLLSPIFEAAAAPCVAPPPPPAPAECPGGGVACVDQVIGSMDARFRSLAAGCDHDAVFALVYLRTTEEFKRAVLEPGFFADTDYLIRQDVLFADYYFRAHDAWAGGAAGQVPEAWRIAFDAARNRAVSGTGNILLGMNAHINRDLPFVLAELGLVFPDGTSRKRDHDRVNDFLWRIVRPALDEVAHRFDPSVDDANLPGTTLDETAFFQLVVSWREGAWQNAVRLVQATNPVERARVEAEIEAAAATAALLLRTTNAYLPLLTSSATRDAWCRDHWNDAFTGSPTSTDLISVDLPGLKLRLRLSPVYPNPFNPQTSFTLAVETPQQVRVEAFDLLGRRVALLHDGPLPAGPHRFTFDGSALPSGRYLLRATGDHFTQQQSMTLMK